MAIVKFIVSGSPLKTVLNYVTNREKTDDLLISGVQCSPETALDEFQFVKRKFRKEDGRQYYHIVQSFSPDDDITPEIAHEIGVRLAEYFKGYQILVATHVDKGHIHNHLVMNSVSYQTGKKFHQTREDMLRVKAYSNRLCREYGLSVTEEKSSFGKMPKWKQDLRNLAYRVACRTRSREEFIYEMEMHGYTVDWREGYKYITFTTPDGHKCRDSKLFAEQLLRQNLEIYYLLGGCESPLAEQYQDYVNQIDRKAGFTAGQGLFGLLGALLTTPPPESRYQPPFIPTERDKLVIMELEQLGIKVHPRAYEQYAANDYEEEQGFYL